MKRVPSFDFVKLISIFSVVVIHSLSFLYFRSNGETISNIGVVLNIAARFAVPFFFAAAGYFFTRKFKSDGDIKVLTKYIKRLAIYFCLATIFYVVFKTVIEIINEGDVVQLLKKLLNPIEVIYYGKAISEHLWFLPALIISVSILCLFIKLKKVKLLLVLGLILNVLGLFGKGQVYSQIWTFNIFTRDALFFGIFYISLGGLFGLSDRNFKPKATVYMLLSLLFLTLQIVEGFILVKKSGFTLWGDFYISTIPLVISLFLFCVSKPKAIEKLNLNKIKDSVLTIYIVHPVFVIIGFTILNKLNLYWIYSTLWWNLFLAPVVTLLSVSVFMIHRKVRA